MVIDDFRAAFPEFTDETVYPDEMLTFWSKLAEYQVVQCVWGDLYPTAVELYVAHEITMAAQNVKIAATGGSPGQSGGIANNKTVGSVSVGYDAASQSEKDAGWWNRTTYGQQLFRLMGLYGAGCIQL